jgi:hypothetical protein
VSDGKYNLCLTAEERQLALDALGEHAMADGVFESRQALAHRLSKLRDKSDPNTAGVYEFKGLDCALCSTVTPHYRKYKSMDRFTCDSCGHCL